MASLLSGFIYSSEGQSSHSSCTSICIRPKKVPSGRRYLPAELQSVLQSCPKEVLSMMSQSPSFYVLHAESLAQRFRGR